MLLQSKDYTYTFQRDERLTAVSAVVLRWRSAECCWYSSKHCRLHIMKQTGSCKQNPLKMHHKIVLVNDLKLALFLQHCPFFYPLLAHLAWLQWFYWVLLSDNVTPFALSGFGVHCIDFHDKIVLGRESSTYYSWDTSKRLLHVI